MDKQRVRQFICWFLGHEPRGPVNMRPIMYQCERCERLIVFDVSKPGWDVYRG